MQIATLIARAIATIGMSAVFFQDSIGLITFDEGFRDARRGAAAHRQGPGDPLPRGLPARRTACRTLKHTGSLSATLTGFSRKTSMMPVISDFLFDDAPAFLRELSQVNNVHDVFIMMVDASFAFELPHVSAGWVEVYDVETGRTRMMSRRELSRQSERVRAWQDDVARQAKAAGPRRGSAGARSGEVRRRARRVGGGAAPAAAEVRSDKVNEVTKSEVEVRVTT